MIIYSVAYFSGNEELFSSPPYFQFAFGCFITIGLPFLTYYQALKQFKSNSELQEETFYIFNEERIEIEGKSFNSNIEWRNINHIIIYKKWFLIQHKSMKEYLIPKRCFNKEELDVFLSFLNSKPELKIELKG